jgi:hypothetical protein
MLIRSQSKEVLVNVDNLAGMELEEAMTTPVIACCNSGCAYVLGKYSSRERAKKVLDMIQEVYSDFEASKIISTGLAAAAWAGDYDTPENAAGVVETLKEYTEVIKGAMVFQMPNDNEVKV